MKIMVTVKQVPDTSGKVAVNDDGTLQRSRRGTQPQGRIRMQGSCIHNGTYAGRADAQRTPGHGSG